MSARRESGSRRRWAYRLIQRCDTPPPRYGSPEWLALPEGDARKVAAVVIAAESWATAGDDLERTLHDEVELARVAHKVAENAEYVARSKAHRQEWGHLRVVRGIAYADTEEFHNGGRSA